MNFVLGLLRCFWFRSAIMLDFGWVCLAGCRFRYFGVLCFMFTVDLVFDGYGTVRCG